MKLVIPQEIELYYIVPSIRKELSKVMSKKGLSQKEISKKLGITESAVSQYLKNKRASKIKFDLKTKKYIEKSAFNIIKGAHVITELQKISHIMKKDLTICKIHHTYDSNIPKECRLCMVK